MKKMRWLSFFAGILLIISSFFIFRNPIINLVTLALLFSFTMLFHGVSEIISYFTEKNEKKKTWTLVNGILTVIIALWILSSSFLELSLILPTIFAFWVLMSGITRTVAGIQLKETLIVILGIIGIIFGFILLYHPLFSGLMISYMIAGTLLFQGIAAIAISFTSK